MKREKHAHLQLGAWGIRGRGQSVCGEPVAMPLLPARGRALVGPRQCLSIRMGLLKLIGGYFRWDRAEGEAANTTAGSSQGSPGHRVLGAVFGCPEQLSVALKYVFCQQVTRGSKVSPREFLRYASTDYQTVTPYCCRNVSSSKTSLSRATGYRRGKTSTIFSCKSPVVT